MTIKKQIQQFVRRIRSHEVSVKEMQLEWMENSGRIGRDGRAPEDRDSLEGDMLEVCRAACVEEGIDPREVGL